MENLPKTTTRRKFVQGAAAGVTTFHFVPAHVFGGKGRTSANEKINVACIGVGNRGGSSVRACSKENLVAFADVDDKVAAGTYKKYGHVKARFKDFRVMLDKLENKIDAVTVGTPDHTHAVAASNAMLRGKHVYCEKPLAHSIHEVRTLMNIAKKKKVITQLGNQGHSSSRIRMFCEWIWDGAIGNVHEVHTFCNAFPHVYSQIRHLPKLAEKHKVPAHLNYDLWLGPAQHKAYSPLWVPWNWRGWMPFGTGCIGDWACHVLDPSMWALDLGAPSSVVAEVDKAYNPEKHADVYPPGVKLTYQFPAKGKRGPVKLVWFDGNKRPPRPDVLEKKRRVPGTGGLVYGDKGVIMHGSHGAGGARIIPEEKMKAYKPPAEKIPRVKSHHWDWLEAIRTGRQAGSNFGYGGPLTEIALIGAAAVRFPGQKLEWDTKAMKFTNFSAANALVNPPYRKGWKLPIA